MSDSDDIEEYEDEEEFDVLNLPDGKVSLQDVIDALFDHVYNLQQFMIEHGHTDKDFKSWLNEYEKRGMN